MEPPKLKPPFSLEIFDSRNTSTMTNPYRNTSLSMMKSLAIKSSMPFKCIIHDVNGNWIEYERGDMRAWSAPRINH